MVSDPLFIKDFLSVFLVLIDFVSSFSFGFIVYNHVDVFDSLHIQWVKVYSKSSDTDFKINMKGVNLNLIKL